MKIAPFLKPLKSTEERILRLLKQPRKDMDLVRLMWPTTQQPEKKVRTVRKYLQGLKRRQMLQEGGGFWWVPRGPGGGSRKRRAA